MIVPIVQSILVLAHLLPVAVDEEISVPLIAHRSTVRPDIVESTFRWLETFSPAAVVAIGLKTIDGKTSMRYKVNTLAVYDLLNGLKTSDFGLKKIKQP